MAVAECQNGMDQMMKLLQDCYKIICELHHTITVMCSVSIFSIIVVN